MAENQNTQTASSVLMIAPTDFAYNVETAKDNHFMKEYKLSSTQEIQAKVVDQHHQLSDALTKYGIKVVLFDHNPHHNTPDACFPNNWFSTHYVEGKPSLVLYPMKAESRRRERRKSIIEYLQKELHYNQIIDLSSHENSGSYLEGTGSLVLDRVNKIAYAVISERTSLPVTQEWCNKLGYHLVSFHAVDGNNRAVYHTNVVMSVGTTYAVVCTQSIPTEEERQAVLTSLKNTNHQVIEITLEQMSNSFCGNVLELKGSNQKSILVMSTAAFNGFTEEQKSELKKHVDAIVDADISLIESIGGGSSRCCIAELF